MRRNKLKFMHGAPARPAGCHALRLCCTARSVSVLISVARQTISPPPPPFPPRQRRRRAARAARGAPRAGLAGRLARRARSAPSPHSSRQLPRAGPPPRQPGPAAPMPAMRSRLLTWRRRMRTRRGARAAALTTWRTTTPRRARGRTHAAGCNIAHAGGTPPSHNVPRKQRKYETAARQIAGGTRGVEHMRAGVGACGLALQLAARVALCLRAGAPAQACFP